MLVRRPSEWMRGKKGVKTKEYTNERDRRRSPSIVVLPCEIPLEFQKHAFLVIKIIAIRSNS